MFTAVKLNTLCVSVLALAFAVSARAQIITTIASGGIPTGKAATSVSIGEPWTGSVDAAGNFYGATDNQVYKVSPAGTITLIAGNASWGYAEDGTIATLAAMSWLGGVVVDASGNVFVADTGNAVVRKIDSATGKIFTVAGNGDWGYSGDGGPATSATLSYPWGVALDHSGNLYIADEGNSRIRKVDAASGNISTVAGTGTAGYSGDGGAAISARLNYPTDVAVDGSGNLYIADASNHVIRKVSAATGTINTVAGTGTSEFSGDGDLGTHAGLNYPRGVEVDSAGSLYISDTGNTRIRKVDPASGIISTVAGNGHAEYSGDGGAATSAGLNYPIDAAVSTTGKLYIADLLNYRIRVVDPSSGTMTTIAGNGHYMYSGDGGPVNTAQVSEVYGVAVDSAGNLYMADTYNDVVRKVDAATRIISTIAGNGEWGYSGDGGPATNAQLGDPTGLAIDRSGNIYIADPDNSVVRKVDASTGKISTVAGVGPDDEIGANTPGTSTPLEYPWAVAVDGSGDLFIADEGNDLVLRLDSSGDLSIVAGNGNDGYSGDGGLATNAELYGPHGLAFDKSGNLYIADSYNGAVREVALDASDTANYGKINTVAGGGKSDDPSNPLGPMVSAPVGVFVDYAGAVFISDDENPRILKVTGSSFASPGNGTLTVAAGTGDYGYSGDGGPATAAEFDDLELITGDLEGNLLIADTGNNRVRSVNGIVTTAPQSVLSPSELGFDTQLLNSSASSAKTITISNPGTSALTVSSVSIGGTHAADFTQTNTCTGAAVAGGSSCKVDVVFKATVAGPESATLTITSNALTSPQEVSLDGAGITFTAPGPAQGGSTSATVTAGTTATYALQISATGGARATDPLTFALTCSGAPDKATCTVPASVVATPGTPGAFNVTVTTTARTTASLDNPFLREGMELAVIPVAVILIRVARNRRKLQGLCLLGLLAVCTWFVACGGSKKPSGTPAGTYQLTVNATSGTVSQSTTLTLVVQ